jgi:hypothetical protein
MKSFKMVRPRKKKSLGWLFTSNNESRLVERKLSSWLISRLRKRDEYIKAGNQMATTQSKNR